MDWLFMVKVASRESAKGSFSYKPCRKGLYKRVTLTLEKMIKFQLTNAINWIEISNLNAWEAEHG